MSIDSSAQRSDRRRRRPGCEVLEQRLFLAAPELQPGVFINSGAMPLQVSLNAIPHVVDWNSDGNKDLLVGQRTSGKVIYYQNQGTDAAPVFGTGTALRAAGTELTTAFG